MTTDKPYATVLEASYKFEQHGDYLQRLGRYDLASREYTKSLHLQQGLFGPYHPIVESFHSKLLKKAGDWRQTAPRPQLKALMNSLQQERHGDYLMKVEYPDKACKAYDSALHVEGDVLGFNHPHVVELLQKRRQAAAMASV
jgi:hypothetical protein